VKQNISGGQIHGSNGCNERHSMGGRRALPLFGASILKNKQENRKMSASICLIGNLGNLGKEPETKITDNGTFIANFSIASNTFRNTPDGRVEKTDWFRVTAFGKQQAAILLPYRHCSDIRIFRWSSDTPTRPTVTSSRRFEGWKQNARSRRALHNNRWLLHFSLQWQNGRFGNSAETPVNTGAGDRT
jgi:hypothetical protein